MVVEYRNSDREHSVIEHDLQMEDIPQEIAENLYATGWSCLNLLTELARLRLPTKLLKDILSQFYSDEELRLIHQGQNQLRKSIQGVLEPSSGARAALHRIVVFFSEILNSLLSSMAHD